MPIAWYATRSMTAGRLASLVWKNIIACEKAGLQVHALICDGHPTNRKMFRIISQGHKITMRSNLMAHNPLAVHRPIALLSDPPHLLKVI